MKKQNIIQRSLRLFFTGFFMGAADLIPGVSGGTIAFLSGIYEELLHSIKTVTGKVPQLVFQGKIKEAFNTIPFKFLIPLGIGVLTALLSLAKLISWLLTDYPVFVWSFFFGLVIASTFIVLKRIVRWDLTDKIAFIISMIASYIVVGAVPIETPNNYPFIFFSGMIAICAMILPGISGSFILLLLGKYQQILAAVTQRDILTLVVFAAGCGVGIALFSRLLSWLFAKHHDISIAVLAGIMIGSVRKIWPWKEVVLTRINSHGVEVPFIEKNILPPSFDVSFLFCVILAIIGITIIIYMDKVKVVEEHVKDIDDKEFEKQHTEALKNQ